MSSIELMITTIMQFLNNNPAHTAAIQEYLATCGLPSTHQMVVPILKGLVQTSQIKVEHKNVGKGLEAKIYSISEQN